MIVHAFKRSTIAPIQIVTWVSFAALASGAHAATNVVDQVSANPLVVSSQAEPNIMFLLDSSGSMDQMVGESFDPTMSHRYDPDTDYAHSATGGTCAGSSANVVGSGRIQLNVAYNGTARFYIGGSGPVNFGYDSGEYCFDSGRTYAADLRTDLWYNYSGTARYSGNFLNWYFSAPGSPASRADFGTSSATRKPYVKSRLEVMKESFVETVQGLSNVRVGMATFDYGNATQWSGMASTPYLQGGNLTSSQRTEFNRTGRTAVIHEPLDSISNNRSSMISAIGYNTGTGEADETTGIDAFGFTPLASALAAVGRYLISGRESDTVTLHPDDSYGVTANDDTASDVLEVVPLANGFTLPSTATNNPIASNSTEWCRKNFIVTLTDGLSDGDRDDFSSDSPLLDYDQDCTGSASCGSYDTKTSAEYRYGGSGSDYLDDVAAALFDVDWLPSINDSQGNAYKNNVISYFVGFSDDADTQLLDDAALNGGGAYVTADDSAGLAAALNAHLDSISEHVGSVAAVAFNSSSLDTGSSVFVAQFNTSRWNGKLFNYELDPLTGNFLDTDGSTVSSDISEVNPSWEAGEILDAVAHGSRNILTYDGSDGVAFTTANLSAGNLSAEMTADLTAGSGTAAEVLDYLRGDNTLEGSQYRVRDSDLGDLVNSTPAFVGDPAGNYPDAAPFPTGSDNYTTWRLAYQAGTITREPMVFVGANDGMLHGFNGNLTTGDDGGDEIMAYVPNFLSNASASDGLHYLSNISYDHQFYVDHSVSIADVYIAGPATATNSWKTLLVGGVRAGGQGLYALDVTDNSFTANDVMWEFSSADDPDLGYTFSRPTIAMTGDEEWSVVVGNGYNSPENGGDGVAKLFILNIEAGLDGWGAGDYIELSTGVGSTTWPNGLSSPRVVDLDGDSVADKVYAGDLYGNLWCFDISNKNTSKWESCYESGGNPVPVFQTTSTSLNPSAGDSLKPITSTPLVGRIPGTSGETVYFGTGQYLLSDDIANADEQSFYAVLDTGSDDQLDESDLEVRTLTTSGDLRTIAGDAVDYTSQFGWFIDFTGGERVVTRPSIVSDILFFNTIIPSSLTCQSGGTGWLMSLDFESGLAAEDGTFDANNDGTIDDDDKSYVGTIFVGGLPSESKLLGRKRYTAGSDGGILVDDVNVEVTSQEGRLSWDEVL